MGEDLNFNSSNNSISTSLNSLSINDCSTLSSISSDAILRSNDLTIKTSLGSSSIGWNNTYYSDANYVSISDSLFNDSNNRIKINEILDDVEKFCKEKCFFGLENICDSEIKCECPLWNRLKCEKRV